MSTATFRSKTLRKRLSGLPGLTLCGLFFLLVMNTNCKKLLEHTLDGYTNTILVADNPFYHAMHVDSLLADPWGMSFSATSPVWISDEATGVSTLYDKDGNKVPLTVTIPNRDSTDTVMNATPTGTVFNWTSDFMFKSGDSMAASKFLFSTLWGQIVAWNSGTKAVEVASQAKNFAVYTGLAMGSTGAGQNYLYAPDFRGGKIDVYDKNFNLVPSIKFHDSHIPAGYSPFNIKNIGGLLYVTYALQNPPKDYQAKAGAGNGIIDIYEPDGSYIFRFASYGALNAPWGIVPAKVGFCHVADSIPVILVGNHGDGRINMYTNFGFFLGPLMDGMTPVAIDSLWDIENDVPGAMASQLYYTAGRHGGHDGNFGVLQRK